MTGDNDEDTTMSPEDIEKLKQAKAHISQASTLLQDVPEDVREDYGDLEDAITKLEEADGLVEGCLPTDEGAGTGE